MLEGNVLIFIATQVDKPLTPGLPVKNAVLGAGSSSGGSSRDSAGSAGPGGPTPPGLGPKCSAPVGGPGGAVGVQPPSHQPPPTSPFSLAAPQLQGAPGLPPPPGPRSTDPLYAAANGQPPYARPLVSFYIPE